MLVVMRGVILETFEMWGPPIVVVAGFLFVLVPLLFGGMD